MNYHVRLARLRCGWCLIRARASAQKSASARFMSARPADDLSSGTLDVRRRPDTRSSAKLREPSILMNHPQD
jgi:hypothetical protein